MNKHNQLRKNAGLLGAICGSLLIGIPVSPLPGVAEPIAQNNQNRPSIFNEPPYNRANTSATKPLVSPLVPTQTKPSMTPPLPENRTQAIARVMPMDGKVDVRLKNNTNALITYEAIGYTQRRTLPGGEEIVLQDLPTPVTVTIVRQDQGLVDVLPISTSEPGLLEVSLDESKSLDDNQGVLRVQRDGQVFLN